MFWFSVINFLFASLAAFNILAWSFGETGRIQALARLIRQMDEGVGRLREIWVLAGLMQLYLFALTIPLKQVHYHGALAWAILLLFGSLESVFTAQRLQKAVASGDDGPLELYGSRAYRGYQVAFNGVVVWVCLRLCWI
jgi:hypothetical protein